MLALFALFGDDLHAVLAKTLFYVGGHPVRVWFLIKSTLYLLFLAMISRVAGYLIERIGSSNPHLSEHRRYVLSRSVSVLIFTVGLFIGFEVEDIQFSTLLLISGTLGIGVGFGMQSLVGNLIAGLILFIEQPIHIADVIEYGNRSGRVLRIGSRCTWIKTSENAVVMIPNSELVSKELLNWSTRDPRVRVSVPLAVAYSSDVSAATQILIALASTHSDVLVDPPPAVVVHELGESFIKLSLRVWTINGLDDRERLRSDFYFSILQRFAEADIEFPHPRLDVHWQKSVPSLVVVADPNRESA